MSDITLKYEGKIHSFVLSFIKSVKLEKKKHLDWCVAKDDYLEVCDCGTDSYNSALSDQEAKIKEELQRSGI